MTRLVSFSCLLRLNMYEGELDKYIGVAAGIRISQTWLASFVDLSNFVIKQHGPFSDKSIPEFLYYLFRANIK